MCKRNAKFLLFVVQNNFFDYKILIILSIVIGLTWLLLTFMDRSQLLHVIFLTLWVASIALGGEGFFFSVNFNRVFNASSPWSWIRFTIIPAETRDVKTSWECICTWICVSAYMNAHREAYSLSSPTSTLWGCAGGSGSKVAHDIPQRLKAWKLRSSLKSHCGRTLPYSSGKNNRTLFREHSSIDTTEPEA